MPRPGPRKKTRGQSSESCPFLWQSKSPSWRTSLGCGELWRRRGPLLGPSKLNVSLLFICCGYLFVKNTVYSSNLKHIYSPNNGNQQEGLSKLQISGVNSQQEGLSKLQISGVNSQQKGLSKLQISGVNSQQKGYQNYRSLG